MSSTPTEVPLAPQKSILARRIAVRMARHVKTYVLLGLLIGLSVLYAYSYLSIAVGVSKVIEAVIVDDFDAFSVAGLNMALVATLGALSTAGSIFVGDVFFEHLRTTMDQYIQHALFYHRAYYTLLNIDRTFDDAPHRMAREVHEIIDALTTIIIGSPIFPGYLLTTSTTVYFVVVLFITTTYYSPLAILVVFIIMSGFAAYTTLSEDGSSKLMSEAFSAYCVAHARLATYAEHVALLGGQLVERVYLEKRLRRVLEVSTLISLFTVTSTFSSTLFFWLKAPLATIIVGVGWLLGFNVFRDPVLLIAAAQVTSNLLTTLSTYPLLLQEWTRFGASYSRVNELVLALEDIHARNEERIEFTTSGGLSLALREVTVLRHGSKAPLVNAITLSIDAASSAVIVGPSGCGKSSLLRVVAGLWPARGTIALPVEEGNDFPVMFIPQRPYLTVGTIAYQVIYPQSTPERNVEESSVVGALPQTAATRMDGQILALLEEVGLGHITERLQMDVFTLSMDWSAVLSVGEQQQVAIARALYHKPVVCIMDEATSDMSEDTEATVLRALLKRNIALLSVAHRSTVQKFHKVAVKLDGTGAWTVEAIEP